MIGELLRGYVESLRSFQHFHPYGKNISISYDDNSLKPCFDHSEDTGAEEPPSSLLWSIVLLAQHFDAVGQSLKALDLIDEAIEHTPTDVQLYMVKARIFKVHLVA